MRVSLVALFQRRGPRVVAAPPDLHLVLAVPLGGLGLVQALQRAVVALVELPSLDDGKPGAVDLVEHDVERVDGTLQVARVANVEIEALGGKRLPTLNGLCATGIGQVDVGPSGEEVLLVPFAFPMPDEDERHGAGSRAVR